MSPFLSFDARMLGIGSQITSPRALSAAVCGWLRVARPNTEIGSGAPDLSQKGAAQVQISGKVPYPGGRWIRENRL
jgi:hypothetical protein